MKWTVRCLILIPFAASISCTKATPTFALLDVNNIPQPMFAGSTSKTIVATKEDTTFAIQGECDPKIRDIMGQALGATGAFGNMKAIAKSTVTVACASTGKFSFELKSLQSLGYKAQDGETYEIELRADTSAGVSNPSYIRITYNPAQGGYRPVLLTGGSTFGATGGTFSADVRVSAKESPVATGGAFSAKVGVRANY